MAEKHAKSEQRSAENKVKKLETMRLRIEANKKEAIEVAARLAAGLPIEYKPPSP